MVVDVRPEFGYDLVCAAPYAYWLHKQGELEKVVTCKGMTPFYYFCDNVEERYTKRSVNNQINGVQNLPNKWIHHNAMALYKKDYSELSFSQQVKVNGVLDYSQWIAPPYKDVYYDESVDLPKKYIIISNRYNMEHGESPVGYFDIECLYNMFNYLTSRGYDVIYKRPKNTEFITDENEWLSKNIIANVEDHGIISDFDLTNYFKKVYNLDSIISKLNLDYNTAQLKIFSRASGFISMGGGSSIFCSYFKVPVIIYVNTSKDIRPRYFEGDSYYRNLSNNNIILVKDIQKTFPHNISNYKTFINTIKKEF